MIGCMYYFFHPYQTDRPAVYEVSVDTVSNFVSGIEEYSSGRYAGLDMIRNTAWAGGCPEQLSCGGDSPAAMHGIQEGHSGGKTLFSRSRAYADGRDGIRAGSRRGSHDIRDGWRARRAGHRFIPAVRQRGIGLGRRIPAGVRLHADGRRHRVHHRAHLLGDAIRDILDPKLQRDFPA